ncbi:hypothetical protein AbraIFM66950_000844 [Aspergillus brasiliensis]|nr:hypothetical protein AbraIFM66950_000844 [Aspergillus brasiliensis]
MSSTPDRQYDEEITRLVEYVYHYEVTSDLAILRARYALMDALGCALETLQQSPECRALIGPYTPGLVAPYGFKLPGTCHQLDPVKGAFDMAALIRFLDHNDAYPGAEWGHPSDNLGAILAVTDWLSRTGAISQPPTVRSVLIAMIKAYEIQGCYQVRNAFNKVGLDHTLLVKIASTAVVAWLMGLTEKQAAVALSHAWADGHPLRIFRQSPNAGPRKGWAAGDAAMRAVHLCFLARAGQPGIPTALSEPNWGFLAVSFGGKELQLPRPFKTRVMEEVFFKLITAEGHGISAVQAAMALAETMASRGIDPATEISRIDIRTHEAAVRIIDKQGPLTNAADRDHCMRYMVSVVLLKNAVIEAEDYHDSSAWAHDPRVEALRQRIHMAEDPQFTYDYHHKKSGASGLTVFLTNGEQLDEVVVEYPIGHPMHEDTLPKVRAKFERNMQGLFTAEETSRVIDAIHHDTLPVHRLVDLLGR